MAVMSSYKGVREYTDICTGCGMTLHAYFPHYCFTNEAQINPREENYTADPVASNSLVISSTCLTPEFM
jgi:hypothetical protein